MSDDGLVGAGMSDEPLIVICRGPPQCPHANSPENGCEHCIALGAFDKDFDEKFERAMKGH